MDEANNAMAKQQFMMQHQHQQQLLLLQQYQQQQQQQQQQIQQQQHQQQIQQQQQQQQIQQQQIQQKQGSQQQQQQQHIQLQQQQQIQQQQHQHQQQQIQQQQIQQQQQQQQQQIQQQQHIQQQQQAISRFPSNIDAHLRSPGLRSLHLQQQLQQQQQQQNMQQQQQQQNMQLQQQKGLRQGSQVEVEMAQQDAWKVCNPDIKTPFSNLEDAVNRLLPYHVVADFEAEEDDRILDSDTTGQIHSRLQQWDHNILAKIAEFTGTFEKQVLAFNIMSRKRAIGEFRAEERLLIEQALLQEEKQTLLQLRAEVESREKAGREAAVEAKMRMAMVQAEQARIEAQAHAEMIARAPMRANAIGSHHSNDGTAHDMGQEQGGNMDETIHGWGSTHRDEGEPSDDFLNDENEPENENEETGLQDEWREVGELDLNTR